MLLDLADELKTERARRPELRLLPGRTIGLIFHKPSTRTRVAFEQFPFLRGFGETPMQDVPFAVLRQPLAQLRPLTDQRFVRDFRRILAQRNQSRLSESVQHGAYLIFILRL